MTLTMTLAAMISARSKPKFMRDGEVSGEAVRSIGKLTF